METGIHGGEGDLRDRFEVHADESPGSWALVILLLLVALGALLGHFLILDAPDAAQFTGASRALELWAGLIGVLCGYSLAAFVVMTRWLWQVLKISRPQSSLRGLLAIFRERAAWLGAVRGLLAVLLTILTVFLVTATIPAGSVNGQPVHPLSGQIIGLGIAGAVIAVPGLAGFLILRALARDDHQWEEPKRQILMAVQLRRYLNRFLGTFGLALTLYVVVTAARRQLILTLYTGAAYPSDYPVLIGLIFAASWGCTTSRQPWRSTRGASACWTNTRRSQARTPLTSQPRCDGARTWQRSSEQTHPGSRPSRTAFSS